MELPAVRPPFARLPIALAWVALMLLAGGAAHAQPFGHWLDLSGPTDGYLRVPDSPDLSPTHALTLEAWVAVTDVNGGHCSVIASKRFDENWWLGVCGTTLRSFVRKGGDNLDAGNVPVDTWTHVAVVYDGTHRYHYIDGELVGTDVPVGGSGPTPNGAEVRIGSDVVFPHTPAGAIDEVRLWRVARTQAEIRSTINVHLGTAQPGLVAVWSLDSGDDPVGGHDGTLQGSGVNFVTFKNGPPCGSTTTQMCLQGNRFGVSAAFRGGGAPGDPTDGTAHVVGVGPGSGVFWFFTPTNWELMVKVLDGCGLGGHYWVYSAGLTDRFFRLDVFDYQEHVNKIYFNYPGAPAPAITDTSAFATCP